jgi:Family of unknown function (DUF6090)
MKENKTSRYFIYALGEILLVVVGILIALQINNLNEVNKQQESVDIYLESLINNLEDDIELMNSLESVSVFRYHSLRHLQKMAGIPVLNMDAENLNIPEFAVTRLWTKPLPDSFDEEFIRHAFLWSIRTPTQTLNQSALNELNSTGLYSHINNSSLKDELHAYYTEWQWRIGPSNKKLNLDLIEKWQDSLAEDGVLSTDPFVYGNPLNLLKNNPQRKVSLERLYREAGWMAHSAQIVRNNAEDLILTIQNDLEN